MTALGDCAEWLLGQGLSALRSTPRGAPARAWVALDQPTWENCCADTAGEVGGQLTCSVGVVVPTTPELFPQPLLRPANCYVTYAVPLAVELVRCMPQPDDRGRVDLGAQQEALNGLQDDGWAMLRAVQCGLGEGYDGAVTGLSFAEDGGCGAATVGATLHLVRI